MKNLVIATVLVMLAPSFGFASQIDKEKCELKNHKNRAALRAQAGEKRRMEEQRESTSKSGGLDRGLTAD